VVTQKSEKMKKELCFILTLTCMINVVSGQDELTDSTKTVHIREVTVSANRIPVLLKDNPGAITLVTGEMLSLMPKGIAAEEALRLVPGVRIDNQHDGERVHISIRGQGILTERGLRGIGVIIDGIPVNDPSGFAPDIYDVDWLNVRKIEVLRGPAAGLYGGGGAAGVLNIFTCNGGPKTIGGAFSQTLGSNGFTKSFMQINGSKNIVDYHMMYSRTDGDGYRDHQAFWSNKIYEKINFHPSRELTISQIISHTDYFQQNPEGLNLQQFDNLLQANPDACPFNEYQKTNRTTLGFHGTYQINGTMDIEATSFLRSWNYKETSNKCAEYRTITNPGTDVQLNLRFMTGNIKNTVSIGSDLKWQYIDMYKLQSEANPFRAESIDETNLETDSLLANQILHQRSNGYFALYKLDAGKFNLIGNIRYDNITNQLTNKMMAADSAATAKNYSETDLRIGASYDFSDALTLFINWSQGFIPPSTEELASNPVGYSGFNTHLVPATSNCYEAGIRGFVGEKIQYELTGFVMDTRNDFFRFKQSGRGNQEVFYGNAGNSKRIGLETFVTLNLLKNLRWQTAYTYTDFKYTSAEIDPVYTDTAYVLTIPPAPGQWLPNSPRHQIYSELIYSINKNLKISLATEYQSKWAIYTDAKAYSGELDPAIFQNWQNGFNLYHVRLEYNWHILQFDGQLSFFVRNMTGTTYMAFTEPDPDGNSYQPGPGREFFANITIKF
jgi:iron complex outermembrane receptor protein